MRQPSQKFDVYSALLGETDITLNKNQRTTFVVFHQSEVKKEKYGACNAVNFKGLKRQLTKAKSRPRDWYWMMKALDVSDHGEVKIKGGFSSATCFSKTGS